MARYGKAAEIAARMLISGHETDPVAAWGRAVAEVYPPGSLRTKCCPRNTFLALCGAGAVQGVAAGSYTRSVKNRGYAERALSAVRKSPDLIRSKDQLWRIATDNSGIAHNSQLEVLASMWDAGLLQGS